MELSGLTADLEIFACPSLPRKTLLTRRMQYSEDRFLAIAQQEKLFEPHDKGTRLDMWLARLGMLLAGGVDGALFIMIGQKMKVIQQAGSFAK